jgi:amidohydrolase
VDAAAVKERMSARIDALADTLLALSHDIHAHPELKFEEHHAHRVLTEALEREGIDVTRSAHGLDTAFDARVGTEGPDIAVCCEYDALPGVGHACGHNIIATAGLGAGLAAAFLADEFGGRVRILGTPAEEGGAGKQFMIEAGAFDGVDAAMMVHPADADLLSMDAIALVTVEVDYEGQPAHAAAFPWKGRNALDAAVLGYMNVAALRQHIEPTDRVHGIFRDGGQAPNIVPEHASMEWLVRSANLATLEPLRRRVEACWEAGAAATGCTCRHRVLARPYADMVDNSVIAGLYARNADSLGRPVKAAGTDGHRVVGSTDMGNVSYVAPSIHPMIRVSPPGVSIHTHDFAAHAVGPMGDEAVIVGAKALAMTIADLWADRELVTSARDAWEAQLASRGQGDRP